MCYQEWSLNNEFQCLPNITCDKFYMNSMAIALGKKLSNYLVYMQNCLLTETKKHEKPKKKERHPVNVATLN